MDRPSLTPLPVVAERIAGALTLLVEALRDALVHVIEQHVEDGYDPADDPSGVSHNVRRYVRERMKPYFPDLSKVSGNMSPVHLDLGPYHLKMVHAEDGELPRPRTARREAYYGLNDLGVMMFDVFPPDGLLVIEDADNGDAVELDENSLVLVWDSEGAELTLATLYRPSLADAPGDSFSLLAMAEREEDLAGIERRERPARETGTDSPGT